MESAIQKENYYLCDSCNAKVEKRIASQRRKKKPTATKPSRAKAKKYVVDEKELFGLKAMGLVPARTYVYLALRIDGYQKAMQSIDPQKFCEKWGLSRNDFLIAIAGLNKKGVVDIEVANIDVKAYSHEEKQEHAKRAINEAVGKQ